MHEGVGGTEEHQGKKWSNMIRKLGLSVVRAVPNWTPVAESLTARITPLLAKQSSVLYGVHTPRLSPWTDSRAPSLLFLLLHMSLSCHPPFTPPPVQHDLQLPVVHAGSTCRPVHKHGEGEGEGGGGSGGGSGTAGGGAQEESTRCNLREGGEGRGRSHDSGREARAGQKTAYH